MSDTIRLLMHKDILIVMTALMAMVLTLLYRMYRGPHVVDRTSALENIYMVVGTIMVLFGCFDDRSLYIDLGLIVIFFGFIVNVIICKFLEAKK